MTLDEKIFDLVVDYDGCELGTNAQAKQIVKDIKRTMLDKLKKRRVYQTYIGWDVVEEILGEGKT